MYRNVLTLFIAIVAIVAVAGAAMAQELNWWSVIYTDSSTEGGSSGSALLNGDGQITGQLTGGNASCDVPLNDPNYYDLYGQFGKSWNLGLSDYLGSGKAAGDHELDAAIMPDALAQPNEAVTSPGLTMQLPAQPGHTVVLTDDAVDAAQRKFAEMSRANIKRQMTGVHVAVPTFEPDLWEHLDNGQGLTSWRIALRAPQAKTLRLHFTRFNINPADAVIVYGDPTAAFGKTVEPSRTATTVDFWGPITAGDLVFLEVVTASKTPPDVTVDKISYGLRQFSLTPQSTKEGDCYLDPNCFVNEMIGLDQLMNGVGQMMFEVADGQAVCTGTMILDEAQTFTPYFYTANHCFQDAAVADSLITSFFWYTDQCNGTVQPWDQVTTYTEGSDILVQSSETDVLLLQLDQFPPQGAAYFGWTTADQQISDPIFVLHHPAGTFMRISFGYINGVNDADDVNLDDDDDTDNVDDDTTTDDDDDDNGGDDDDDDDDDSCCGC